MFWGSVRLAGGSSISPHVRVAGDPQPILRRWNARSTVAALLIGTLKVLRRSGATRITSKRGPDEFELSGMEYQIHHIEMEAYGAVLRAFNAQSDVLSWTKEGLMSELRKELRVSDAEHREILAKVNLDDSIKTIRARRNGTDLQQEMLPNMVNAPGYPMIPVGHVSHKRLKIPHVHVRDDQWDTTAILSPQANFGQAIKSVPQNKHTSSLGKGTRSMVAKSSRKSSVYSGADTLRPGYDIIKIRATEKLIQEVERVCGGKNPDPVQVEKAKLILREHERSLIEAIAKLADVPDDG